MDRMHVDTCASRAESRFVKVKDVTSVIQQDLRVSTGVQVLVTVVKKSRDDLPALAFLASGTGLIMPLQRDSDPGHFWTVAPPFSLWRIVTSKPRTAVALPPDLIQTGPAGLVVNVTVSR